MKFDLTAPCKDCPFRTDVKPYLTRARAKNIVDARLVEDRTFSCHKTNSYGEDGDTIEFAKSQHCAGALILCEKSGRANQMMRIAERLGLYDARKLKMDAPVYENGRAMVLAHGRSR